MSLSHSGSLATSGTIPHSYPLRVWNGFFGSWHLTCRTLHASRLPKQTESSASSRTTGPAWLARPRAAIANGTPTNNNHRAPDCINTAVQRRQRGRMISGFFEWVGLKLRVHDFLLRTYTSVTVLALLLLNTFLIFRRARSARWRQPIANISDA